MRAVAQRVGLAVAVTAGFLAIAAPSALGIVTTNCSTCTWSGGGDATNSLWSNSSNWSTPQTPSSSTTSIDFPSRVDCSASPSPCSSENDISGVATTQFTIDDTTAYYLYPHFSGGPYPLAIGSGGLTASAGNCASQFSQQPYITLPITLSAAQIWTIDGCPAPSGVLGGLGLFGAVTGTADDLTVDMNNGSILWLSNVNVGTLHFSGSSGGGAVALQSLSGSGGSGPSSLNGTSYNPVSFTGGVGLSLAPSVGYYNTASTGPLTMMGGDETVGVPGHPAVLTPQGNDAFDSSSTYGTTIDQAGDDPRHRLLPVARDWADRSGRRVPVCGRKGSDEWRMPHAQCRRYLSHPRRRRRIERQNVLERA